jgi:hypothetical protein
MDKAVAHMLSKKDEIMTLLETHPDLSRRSRSRNVKYVEEFFAILEDEAQLQQQVLGRCRGADVLEEMLAGEEAEAPKDST